MRITLLLISVLSLFAAGSGYHKVKSLPVGGDGGWDYLIADSQDHRLYVSHATQVIVFDTKSGEKIGAIPDTPGVHGVAVAHRLGLGFVSAGRANNVVVFDLKTFEVKSKIDTGKNPDWIYYDEASNKVFTCNGGSNDLTVIDAATLKVVGTTPLGGKPETAMSDGGKLFINLEDKSSIVVVDTKSLKLEKTWPLAPCEEPTGLDIDRKNKRVFAGCGNKTMVAVDYTTGKVVGSVTTGEGTDALSFDPALGYIYTSNGQDGTMSVIHQDSPTKYTLVENVPTAKGARTMAVDTETHTAYLAKAEYAPAAPAADGKKAKRPSMVPGSMEILVFAK
jgi:YVTN family beta-propeller protein